MPKAYYLPSDDAGRLVWFNNFGAKLPNYFAALGLTAAELAAVQADIAFFSYALNAQQQVAAYAQQWTTYKNAARDGGAPSLAIAPAAPVLLAAPALVAPDILGRIKALVGRIKKATGYTEAIGQALKIIGAEQTVDLASLKPLITAVLAAGGVVIGWTKQGLSGLEILVDRGDGKGFVFLALDTIPDYTDTLTLPTGQTALWKYKAIYHQGDDRVGQWSDVVSLAVAG